MKRLTVAGLMLGMMLMMAVCAFGAVVPQVINYSGTLTNVSGSPVPDGTYNIEFNVYGVPTGGTPLWTEKWSSTATPPSPVLVAGGAFNVMLGAITAFPNDFFANNPNTYLGIKVGADSEMLPRQKIASVGYAFASGNGVPKGGVIMWSGAVNQVPDGWALCDGQNGDKGGSAAINLNHSHTVNNHIHSINHTHTYSGTTSGTTATREIDDGNDHNVTKDEHTHTYSGTTSDVSNGSSGGASPGTTAQLSSTQDIRPPYYALAFIIKL